MNIAYVVGEFPSVSETFILREIAALTERGLRIHVFALRRGDPGQTNPPARRIAGPVCYLSAARLPGALARRLAVGGQAATAWRRCCRPAGVTAGAIRRFLLAAQFADAAAGLGVEHVHAHFAYVTADVAAAMSSLIGVPFSISAHAWDLYAQAPGSARMRMRGAAFVAACTRQGRDRIEELLRTEPPARVVLCPHGVFPADFTPGPAEGRSILAVGRLEPKKGLRHLVAACRILAADGEDFRCAIVGDGSERAGLRKEAERAGLAERLTFTGALTGEALIERYREAALFVLPSVVAPDGDRDGLANVVLEAMAMGLPVVGTDASSCAEAVIDGVNGFLVPAGDAPALAESLKRLLRDPALRQRMGARNRTVVEERFDIRRNVETLAAQFKSGA